MAGLDIIIFVIVAVAAIGGFMRGLVQEVLSLASWVFAALAVGSRMHSRSMASRPLANFVVLTYLLRYHVARPPSSRTPCTMPSPKNQCPVEPSFGFEPLRT